MSKVNVTPGATVVTVTMDATQAAALTSLLNHFYIPAKVDSGLGELRTQLRAQQYPGARFTSVSIRENDGSKPYKIAA